MFTIRERYRDLIEAADTIAEMEKTSESAVSKIANIVDTCRQLQEKYLIGFKMMPDKIFDERYCVPKT